jgi:ABC-type uncharacterized transport system fused permease/ATPase subunit
MPEPAAAPAAEPEPEPEPGPEPKPEPALAPAAAMTARHEQYRAQLEALKKAALAPPEAGSTHAALEQSTLEKFMAESGFVRKAEFDALQQKLAALEAKLAGAAAVAGAAAAAAGAKAGESKKEAAKEAPKKKQWKETVKIVDVVDFTWSLIRGLLDPARFSDKECLKDKSMSTKFVFRLYDVVWPRKFFGAGLDSDGQQDGSREILYTVGLAFARTYIMNSSANHLMALQNAVYETGSLARFMAALPKSVVLTVLGSLISSAMSNVSEKLTITWRDKLTREIHRHYFSRQGYYHMKNLPGRKAISDPDERLAGEVLEVTRKLTMIVGLLVRGVPPIIWFTLRLWRQKGLAFATLPHIYLLAAYEITSRLFPKNVIELIRKQSAVQGAYFKSVSRVQTHSEAILALNGCDREHEICRDKFGGVSDAATELFKCMSKFGLIFKVAYSYGCRSWIATSVMLPLVLSGGPVGDGAAAMGRLGGEVGQVRYGMDIMVEMLVANGTILTLHYVSQQMGGQAYRIAGLLDTVIDLAKERAALQSDVFVDGAGIAFEDTDVFTPNGKLLVKNLNFALEVGGSLLLTGHNGAGKSSIFRCLGGLWSVKKGTITKPGGAGAGLSESVFYLPQKPYNVLGSLQDQITYPKPDATVTDTQLRDILRRVDLLHLLDESSAAADTRVNWEDKLSLGEQQRLAMGRLFYHLPKFAILDECTSAVSLDMEAALYDECKKAQITYITICHRPALKAYHTHNLNLTGDGKGGWEYTEIDHARVRSRALASGAVASDKELAEAQKKRSAPYGNMASPDGIPKRSSLDKLKMLLAICLPGSSIALIMLIAGIIGRTLMHEGYSYVVGSLYKATVTRNVGMFAFFAVVNVAQDMLTALVEEGVILQQELVGVMWRESLTKYCMEKFFTGANFYSAKNVDKRIPDIDQRLTKEIVDLSKEFPKMFASAVTPLFDVVWFSSRMISLVGLGGMGPFYVYIIATFVVVKFFMPNHEELDTEEKKLESDYRFCQTRLVTHAESIAFFTGDDLELKISEGYFRKLIDHMYHVRWKQAQFKFLFNCISKDFKGSYSKEVSTPEMMTIYMQMKYAMKEGLTGVTADAGAMAQRTFYVRSAIIRTIESFGQLFDLYETLAKLLGSGTRVCQMIDVLDDMTAAEARLEKATRDDVAETIEFTGVDLVTPLGQCLAQDLTVTVDKGACLLVTGPNSTGKTSFFRALAGIWGVPKGSIASPGAPAGVFLVPQRAYSATGSLADQITYPLVVAEEGRDEVLLAAILERVGVLYLVDQFEKEGGWNAVKAWEDTLSGGEQQRIGIARIFYHQPTFAVLDECTDAVSVDVEEKLYTSLVDAGVTIITISKRLALTEFHAHELQFGAPTSKGWDYHSIPHDDSDEA